MTFATNANDLCDHLIDDVLIANIKQPSNQVKQTPMGSQFPVGGP